MEGKTQNWKEIKKRMGEIKTNFIDYEDKDRPIPEFLSLSEEDIKTVFKFLEGYSGTQVNKETAKEIAKIVKDDYLLLYVALTMGQMVAEAKVAMNTVRSLEAGIAGEFFVMKALNLNRDLTVDMMDIITDTGAWSDIIRDGKPLLEKYNRDEVFYVLFVLAQIMEFKLHLTELVHTIVEVI